jgi:ABC-type uncharacterized transport system YnjBCD ATPase subunit
MAAQVHRPSLKALPQQEEHRLTVHQQARVVMVQVVQAQPVRAVMVARVFQNLFQVQRYFMRVVVAAQIRQHQAAQAVVALVALVVSKAELRQARLLLTLEAVVEVHGLIKPQAMGRQEL